MIAVTCRTVPGLRPGRAVSLRTVTAVLTPGGHNASWHL